MGVGSGIEHRWSGYLGRYVQVGVASNSAVSVAFVDEPDAESVERAQGEGSDALRAVFAYLDGEGATPDVPYALTVSGVERRALERTRDVPYGTTTTYAEFGSSIGEGGDEEGVARVREALHGNPVPIVLPSHRIVAEDGIGGFVGPREVKRKLLELEGV
ncbi:methylated-DNA--[protein]-cysteine S-methyltransferase [Haladaptatus sp. F3-133]|uniref:Methylated-DNA--[protein]-cysteine S-methyltransferase n=1 Tax=Halorutilus salinus TaxID=2487751 RepID=A0A9Q4C509_9EURY|nr:methylated-DNA--[protein]-cysteine S-methyltransferase [Halorutilus salinus]MCX2819311.1 methylated-DNA--[protein]-cysteine S-methyltransferase [Halorutilus salinus]